ncbi:HupE/UreJ family protein [Paenibacillus albiflavus]|uniref:HupE/UreJ family protein n=1 Tax=Paenibacillus albiflavus TaxID=2545760 RepID=A0A4R4EDV0_9BACL|nr:HupE/UreJ family protein [Paenibacillus albiflavus]TCZ77383.1 HupE/UreJ family protein [Paenibacillus albiflavus]
MNYVPGQSHIKPTSLAKLCRDMVVVLISFILVMLPLSRVAEAHAYSVAYSTLVLSPDRTEYQISFDELTIREELELTGVNVKIDQEQLQKGDSRLKDWINQNLTVEIDNQQAKYEILSTSLENVKDKPFVVFDLKLPKLEEGQTFSIKDNFFSRGDNGANYANFVTIDYGNQKTANVLQGQDRVLTMIYNINTQEQGTDSQSGVTEGAGTAEQAGASAEPSGGVEVSTNWWSFIKLGMNHILSGFDHLLFIFALLLGKQTFKQYAGIITSFTIAHSITLTLAVLGWVDLPGYIVEPAIAFSICYVAAENMLRQQIKYRWLITFAFGLIHGMGFADILKEMSIPTKQLAISLISFNVGIEIVQLTIVAIVLPILIYFRKFASYKHAVVFTSSIIILVGGFWFIQRVFF